jgi:hypothetical protein
MAAIFAARAPRKLRGAGGMATPPFHPLQKHTGCGGFTESGKWGILPWNVVNAVGRALDGCNPSRRQPEEMTTTGNRSLTWALIWVSLFIGLGYHLAIALRAREMLPDRPFRDDSFYALTVSRNLALGKGLTVSDGEISTNGIQPLFVFICAIPYFYMALRLVQIVHLLVHIASTVLLFFFIRKYSQDRLTPWIGTAIWACSFNILTQVANGLETGFYLLMLQLCIWYYIRYAERGFRGIRRGLVLGALLGLTTLTRIDGGLLCGAMGLHFILVNRGRGILGRILEGPLIWLAAWLSITLPWWLYNLRLTGNPLPTSGLVQLIYDPTDSLSDVSEILTNLWYAVQVILDHLLLFVFTPLRVLSTVTPASVLILLTKIAFAWIMLGLVRKAWRSTGVPSPFRWRTFGFFPVFIAALFLFYVFVFNAEWYMNRYLIPLSIASAAILPLALERLDRRYAQAMLAANVLFTVGMGGYTYTRICDTTFADHWGWVEANLPESTWVAAAQSGTLGYFHDRTINTDGKVNTELFTVRLGGFGKYLANRNIDYFIEWGADVMFYDSTFKELYAPFDTCGRSLIYRRRLLE